MANSGAGSKADAAVKLVLVFFVSLLSFSVGTFVGKKVSDANHKRADLENEYDIPGMQDRTVASVKASPDAEAVSDEEVAALTKEFIEAERNVASNDTADTETTNVVEKKEGYKKMGANEVVKVEKKTKTTTTAKKVNMNDKVKTAADRIAKDMAPAKDVKVKKTPSKSLPAVATTAIGKYTVQVASYASEAEARVQVAKLKDKGYGAFYVPASVKGQTWYRVSIGLFTDQKSATNYRQEVIDSRVVSSAIVQRIVK